MAYLYSLFAVAASLINYYFWQQIDTNPYWSIGFVLQVFLLVLALMSITYFRGVKLKIQDKKYQRAFFSRLALLSLNLGIVGIIFILMFIAYF
ncbi:hypothetical protein HOY36_08095 [Enterococcus sp. MMGLQ5-2]|uniref:hypothetical protein n=1 Tax=Enterococcus sp. MMGLQ5-2 TaxID=2737664 RepID=UPI0015580DF2|nr:hypothetical protein [Enterococcus sp. MMGLQ5-2]MBS7577498.1 hypothetical protein [Enterococcus sp. MMGLQ5-2]NPD37331.1 hypothetical protein [Enterococcus sp. MMGLQ5-2]